MYAHMCHENGGLILIIIGVNHTKAFLYKTLFSVINGYINYLYILSQFTDNSWPYLPKECIDIVIYSLYHLKPLKVT